MRADPLTPLAEQVQLQPTTQNSKWRVESYQARDGRYLAPRTTEGVNRTVNGLKPAQRSMTAFKLSQRRKRYALMSCQAKKKMLKLKTKKTKVH